MADRPIQGALRVPDTPKNHDIPLPAWGPYSKAYAGTAHIPDVGAGLRFDLTVVPGYFRQTMVIPNEHHASGTHAWEAAADLSYYAFRYQLEWRDAVYCDVSYSAISDQARLVRCEFVNNTQQHQNLMMHLIANMNFPPLRPDEHGMLQIDHHVFPANVEPPDGGLWIDALDYADLRFAQPRPTDHLVTDGWVRGEFRDHGLTNGSGVGRDFGRDSGDEIRFDFSLDHAYNDPCLVFRVRAPRDSAAPTFRARGIVSGEISFASTATDARGFSEVEVPMAALEPGQYSLTLQSLGTSTIELDGFAIIEWPQRAQLSFREHRWTPKPHCVEGPVPESIILSYADSETVYGLAWDHSNSWLREFITNHLDEHLRFLVPNNYTGSIDDGGNMHYTDVFLRPIPLKPNDSRIHYALVCAGSRADVEEQLRAFHEAEPEGHEKSYTTARAAMIDLTPLPAGETFQFSQDRMAATEMLNIVYPVYTRRQYIRNFCPGKWWDSLYTWDAGFIAKALLEYAPALAEASIDSYLTDDGDDHAAFVNHGSLIPTQIYAFHELWNRTQDQRVLETLYPRLRQYYRFLAGHHPGSDTRDLASGLIRTWQIFRWDSGGWDDYPAQMHTIDNDLDETITCVAVTAHVIRAARTLHAAAVALDLQDDQALYEQDIATLGSALQDLTWDEESGYFSYLEHDAQGAPIGHLNTSDGVNFNMGLDGVMPLYAGICTSEQESLFFERLADPDRFWTRIGLSTVDQSAPYYRTDGYWNGAVWMPHQWFIWKTALDTNRGDFAYQIAETALNLWKKEVETSYYCFEHFLIESGRGAGWHQFGALSSPVVSWFAAYHLPGKLTTGMDVWVEAHEFSDANESHTATLRLNSAPRTATVIVNLQPGNAYEARWAGQKLAVLERNPGSLEISIPFEEATGRLEVRSLSG